MKIDHKQSKFLHPESTKTWIQEVRYNQQLLNMGKGKNIMREIKNILLKRKNIYILLKRKIFNIL